MNTGNNTRDDIIILTDNTGKAIELEFLEIVHYKGSDYAVMLPLDDTDDEAADVVILLMEEADDETDSYSTIADAELLKNVFAVFKENFKDTYQFA